MYILKCHSELKKNNIHISSLCIPIPMHVIATSQCSLTPNTADLYNVPLKPCFSANMRFLTLGIRTIYAQEHIT